MLQYEFLTDIHGAYDAGLQWLTQYYCLSKWMLNMSLLLPCLLTVTSDIKTLSSSINIKLCRSHRPWGQSPEGRCFITRCWRTSSPKRKAVRAGRIKLRNKELHTFTLHQILFGWAHQGGGGGRVTWHLLERGEKQVWIWWKNMQQSSRLEDLGVDDRVVLKLMLRKQDGRTRTGFMWVSMRAFLKHGNELSGFTKRREFLDLLGNH
jgi:hypothetical protein